MYLRGILSISEVNALSPEQFEWLFGNVVEHHPNAAQQVASMRPFTSVRHLKNSFYEYLEKLDSNGKENLLLRYPDLPGKYAEGLATIDSEFERENVPLQIMSKEEKQLLGSYNNLYKEKFRFPFVICISKNEVQTILSSIQIRLQNTRHNELNVGIHEVKKICNNRIDDLIWSDV
ncbi:2-oxo-4-hydroxy-4-carboxy-5-ureidoimidazoline decarboxylase-like [Hylaeus volcanicus]|uniref:2-oxo-4-hydroxy-4-carboxy-5-ureidoimidazoline decarboxylase-like n=1 Tax=Hylaeus volcanicus TaxID=313075 RepID=UPI0023B812D0|nr:2-oxo-4-hydroxy-4-carboxy-5-ureidoimidazoline decarboxylase-like [Hylaeus volcanicus]